MSPAIVHGIAQIQGVVSTIAPYAAAAVAIILAGPGLFPDYFSKTRRPVRLVLSLFLALAVLITLWNIHEGNKQHGEDVGTIESLRTDLAQSTQLQRDNAKVFSDGQQAERKAFQAEFDKMTDRVAQLQTQVATTDLKTEADKLQADLEATRKAMNPDKVSLTFSFIQRTSKPIHTVAVQQTNNIVHLKFWVDNPTDTDALDGDLIIVICDDCKFRSEPAGSQHILGSPETQRNISFERVLAHTQLPTIEFDVEEHANPFSMAVFAVCHTCELRHFATDYSNSLATISITNPQAELPRKYPSPTVKPYFGPKNIGH